MDGSAKYEFLPLQYYTTVSVPYFGIMSFYVILESSMKCVEYHSLSEIFAFVNDICNPIKGPFAGFYCFSHLISLTCYSERWQSKFVY